MSTVVRVLRVLEYVGTMEWIEKTLQRGGVPANGAHQFETHEGTHQIRSAVVGSVPEILERRDTDDATLLGITVRRVRPYDDLRAALDAILEGRAILPVVEGGFSYTVLRVEYGLKPWQALVALADLRERPEETREELEELAQRRKAEEELKGLGEEWAQLRKEETK